MLGEKLGAAHIVGAEIGEAAGVARIGQGRTAAITDLSGPPS